MLIAARRGRREARRCFVIAVFAAILRKIAKELPLREKSIPELNQNLSQVIAAAEAGETIIVTKEGTPVARITSLAGDRPSHPDWKAAHDGLRASFKRARPTIPVGHIAEDDLDGDGP